MQSGNLAFLKETSQSTTFRKWFSRNAVGPYNHHSLCTHTESESMPWWKVDLGADYYVSKVYVRNRHDCCWDRLKEFQVRIGASVDDPMGNPMYDIFAIDSFELLVAFV